MPKPTRNQHSAASDFAELYIQDKEQRTSSNEIIEAQENDSSQNKNLQKNYISMQALKPYARNEMS